MTPKFEKGDVVYCEKYEQLAIVYKASERHPVVLISIDNHNLDIFLKKDLTLISKHDFQ